MRFFREENKTEKAGEHPRVINAVLCTILPSLYRFSIVWLRSAEPGRQWGELTLPTGCGIATSHHLSIPLHSHQCQAPPVVYPQTRLRDSKDSPVRSSGERNFEFSESATSDELVCAINQKTD